MSSTANFKVVLPLTVGGESEKYPQKFRELGVEFVGKHCATDDEFIKLARGGFVDEVALYRALKEGKIAMAALDVTEPEPPKPRSPLLVMDNVISTAHSAFFSPTSEAERWHRPVEEVARVMRGEWPRSVVNPQAKEKYVARWGAMKEPG